MISQMRVYTINKGKLDDFVAGWKKFVYPLHYQFGFTIPHSWVIRERNEFVWIVSYDGPGDWDAKQAAYYGSPERASVDPAQDPAQYMAKTERWFIDPIAPTE